MVANQRNSYLSTLRELERILRFTVCLPLGENETELPSSHYHWERSFDSEGTGSGDSGFVFETSDHVDALNLRERNET
jgi:hypothetical protein